MPSLGAILASRGRKQANRNVNTLLYPRALNWSGSGRSSLSFGLIWLNVNGNPSKARYQPVSDIICFHEVFFPSPRLAEASWCNGGGGQSGDTRLIPSSSLLFDLLFLACFEPYHSQHQ